VLQDCRFNVVATLGSDGVVVERFAYSAFGTPTFLNELFEPIPASLREWEVLFSAYSRDYWIGTYSARNRSYHSQLGRWITRDPMGELDGPNLFVAMGNDPINGMDYSGLLVWKNKKVKYGTFTPGQNVSTAAGNFSTNLDTLAAALPDWTIKAICVCDPSTTKWNLDEFNIDFTPTVFLRAGGYGGDDKLRRWVTRAENDHSNDYYSATYDAKKDVKDFEKDWAKTDYYTDQTCKDDNSKNLQDEMKKIFDKAIADTKAKHDATGKHTWTGPNQRP
jgi:RHS repeat-associated protein